MVATRKKAPTKLPRQPYTVSSDDFVVEEDGVEYRPHQGESVTFRGRMTVGDYLNAISLSRFSAEAMEDADKLFGQTIENLANRIVSWDWTGDYGEQLPAPTAEVLKKLSFEELVWIIGKANGQRTDDESKNGSSPST
jgi:hypothetical protein